jgi:integrase
MGNPSKIFEVRGKSLQSRGVPNLLFHDLRRTAARNYRRAGVAEGVIMKIGGWKPASDV